jgi:ABC-type multidrug transport system fused ATPase/permease subunit
MFFFFYRAPMSFFNSTPLSRILSRFSKDINVLDQSLQGTLGMYGKQLAIVTSTFLLISIAAPWFSPFCLILTFVYITIQHYYIPTSRQLQRIDSVLKSPVSAHMSMTLSGLPTIRAFQFQNRLQKENRKRIDSQQKAITLLIFSNRWLATRLEFLGTLTVTFASTFVLFQALNNSISSGLVGLLISDALNITQSLNWMVRMAR